jgi:SAM-dependent methyltransferase
VVNYPQRFEQAILQGDCYRIVLSKARQKEIARITIRPLEIKGTLVYQFAERRARQELHVNRSPEQTVAALGELFPESFSHGHLFTSRGDYAAVRAKDGSLSYSESKATLSAQPLQHDRGKNYLIADGTPCDFLIEIGVMNQNGRVRASRYDKFRQINRFLELVDDVVKMLPATGVLKIVDFGCGKSYLTFALHHLLTRIHNLEVDITGLDLQEDVIRDCSSIAQKLDSRGLTFRVSDISEHQVDGDVDMCVSLHACDTATDAALAKAIQWNSRVILAVPCCQQEFADKLEENLLPAIQKHGILKQRFAAIATDALRAEVLEACGYRTQVMEFIDMEHTAKNLLIRAVAREGSERQDVRSALSDRQSYQDMKRELGLHDSCLEDLLLIQSESV